MSEPLLEIHDLCVEFPTRTGLLRAVDHVNLTVRKGEVLGLVGESGCGKSTLGMAILRLLRPPGRIVGGEVIFRGRQLMDLNAEAMRKLRGASLSMVFQDPMTCLNPLQRISDHMMETIRTHLPSMPVKEARQRAGEILDRLGITAERLDDYPHQLSGGMRQRVMIGLALALDVDLIIADEPTTSLDVIVEAQFLDQLRDLQKQFGLTIILITHNIGIVAELSDRVAVMYAAHLVELADVTPLFNQPLHPYTQALLKSVPNIRLSDDHLEIMSGAPPDLINPPQGCRFHPRCPHVMERCRIEVPVFKTVSPGRWTACWLYE